MWVKKTEPFYSLQDLVRFYQQSPIADTDLCLSPYPEDERYTEEERYTDEPLKEKANLMTTQSMRISTFGPRMDDDRPPSYDSLIQQLK